MSLPTLHEPLGKLVVTFGQLEFMLMVGMTGMLRDEADVCFALISQMSFARRLNAFRAIAPYRIKDPALLAELDEVIGVLSEAGSQRNSAIHSAWMARGSEKKISRVKITVNRKHGFKSDFRYMTAEEVTAVVDVVSAANTRFAAFMSKVEKAGASRLKMFSEASAARR